MEQWNLYALGVFRLWERVRMADRIFDAVIFVKQTPTIGYDDGLFHVCYEIGRGINAEFVMQPSVYFRALSDAVEVSRQHRRGSVTDIHAASASGKSSK